MAKVLTLPPRKKAGRGRRKAGEMEAFPGAAKPEDALKRLHVLLAAKEKPAGIVIVAIDEDGFDGMYLFGSVKRSQIAMTAAYLTDYAVNGGEDEG